MMGPGHEKRTHAGFILSTVVTAAASFLLLLAVPGVSARARAQDRPPDGTTPPAGGCPEVGWVIESALSQPHLRGARVAVVVESRGTRRVLFERDSDVSMIPASNMKLVTAAAALSLLGPDHRFETVVSTDAPVLSSTLDGNLYVRGSGDPSLVTEELWKIAEAIRVLGIERVAGDLVLDAGYFDSVSTTSPAVADGDRAYHARTGALSLNFNSIAVHTVPGASRGDPAVVSLAPATPFVELVNEATTCSRKGQSSLSVKRTFDGARNVINVEGRIPAGTGVRTHYRSLDDAPGYFGSVMRSFMAAQGTEIAGATLLGSTPEGATVVTVHRSKPLSLIVRDLNKFSNNFVAEQLLKVMSAEASGVPGSTEGGLAVLVEHLVSTGVPAGSFVVRDGSGFSRENRLSPRALATVVQRALADFDMSYEFVSSLSVSGTDGTLEDRMGYPVLRSAVRAKTGLLDGVTAVSGLVENEAGEELVFSIMINGFDCEAWRAHDLEHSILAVIKAHAGSPDDEEGNGG